MVLLVETSIAEDVSYSPKNDNRSSLSFGLGELVLSPFKTSRRLTTSAPRHIKDLPFGKQKDNGNIKDEIQLLCQQRRQLLALKRQLKALKRIHQRIQGLTQEEMILKKQIKSQLNRAKSRFISKNKRGAIVSMHRVVKLEEKQAKLKSAIGYLRALEINANAKDDAAVGDDNNISEKDLARYENFETDLNQILKYKKSALDNYFRFQDQIDVSMSGANRIMSDEKLLRILGKLVAVGQQQKQKKTLDFSRHSSIHSISRHSSIHSMYSEGDTFGDHDYYDGDVDYEHYDDDSTDVSDDASFA